MTLSELSIKRPVFTTMTSLGVMVLGTMGLMNLGVDLFPDVQFPVVTVATVYPGASPAEVESQVTEEIEDAVVSLSGIDQMISYSRDSLSQVVVLFELDTDVKQAALEVRERVSQIRGKLPRDVKDPTFFRVDVSASPIVIYTLSGPQSTQAIRDLADDYVKNALEQVEGVGQVNVRGGFERQINVEVNAAKLEALHLTPIQVVERLAIENLTVPAGSFDTGSERVAVRTSGEVRTIAELRNLPLFTAADGTLVRLSDVAVVSDSGVEVTTEVRSNGQPAVVLEVQKASGENTIEVAKLVRERIAELVLPEGMQANLIIDTSTFVLENAHEVQIALVFGGIMAILVILLFLLDVRSTLISAVALPTSVIGSFWIMDMFGFTLNMMTLLGLSLAIGLLIDDSIVVRENIMKHLERGKDPKTAALEGTREITLAVLATTATLCAVFVPIAFTTGMVGQFFREFGITVAGATVLSAWVALTLDPMLSAYFAGKHGHGSTATTKGPVGAMHRFYKQLDALYGDVLKRVLSRRRNRWAVGLGALGLLVGSFGLLVLMGSEFTAPEDRGQFIMSIDLPAGTSLTETSARLERAEKEVSADKRFVNVYSTIGVLGDSHRAEWRVITTPKWERKESVWKLAEFARARVEQAAPEAEIFVSPPSFVEGLRDLPMAIYVRGENFADLESIANKYAEVLRSIHGVRDVDVQYSPGKPEVQVSVDHQVASQRGVPTAMIARTLRSAVDGEVATVFRDGSDTVDVRVRLREEDRGSKATIGALKVQTPTGALIPVSDVAALRWADGPAMIQRHNRQRVIVVGAAPDGRPLGEVVAEFEKKIAPIKLPEGVTWKLEGQAKMMGESFRSIGIAMLLGLLFIFMVLAAQFESFIHPITIMMAVPLAIVGAIMALFLGKSSVALSVLIGIILLIGLVTKNGILLVDHALQRMREGWSAHDAIVDAGPSRLRPILMTSAAMVLGMLPTALSNGSGSEFRGPMAVAVIGGVISSTVLTLLVVPVFFLAVDGVRQRVLGIRNSMRPRPMPTPAE